ncbi:MAG: hypothetical protein M3131_05265 [Actinomycetota bacterium]|nr:hypothetical protein [Actinomycetota bacterium]
MREFARIVRYDALSGLASWRWLAVPVVFGLACWSEVSYLLVDRQASVNVWDGPLSMLQNQYVVIFGLGLGFLLVLGDRYPHDRSRGTVALTVIRTRSRTKWWLGRLASVGVLALAFSALGLGGALLVSAIRLPLDLDPSTAALLPFDVEAALYPRFEGLPMPIFFGFVVLYTALALWPLGALIVAASVLRPAPYVPIGVAMVWVLLEAFALPDLFLRGHDSADPFYHLLFGVHFQTPRGVEPTSWLWSALVTSAALGLAGAVGALTLRRSDV